MGVLRNVAVVGATGIAGRKILDVISERSDRFRATVLIAHRDVQALTALCIRHRPNLAVIVDPQWETKLARRLTAAGVRCDIASGEDALCRAAESSLCDILVSATPGITSLDATLKALRAGKRLVIAGKELGLVAGCLLREAADAGGGQIIPLTSAAFAVARHLDNRERGVTHVLTDRLILSSSGGPLAGRRRADMMSVSADEIGVAADASFRHVHKRVASATQIDLGFEAISLRQLFGIDVNKLDVRRANAAHTQVWLQDQTGACRSLDYTLPKAERIGAALEGFQAYPPPSFDGVTPVFEQPDVHTFRCLGLALAVLKHEGDGPVILNAANQVATAAFRVGALPFLSIADVIERVLMELPPQPVVDTQTLSERDRAARATSRRVLRSAC